MQKSRLKTRNLFLITEILSANLKYPFNTRNFVFKLQILMTNFEFQEKNVEYNDKMSYLGLNLS